MSYQVLARKWRPQIFKEMVGQEHILQALINALDHDRLHHAYLFTGTRGVGKTTVARILAKCLNCEVGVSSQPCGECAACLEIAEGRSVDLIEVDAASRTKVEDTRELLENVQYAPTRCRYKVYLIDEVHMLSTSSFNALLKTLEEPPPHVKFLLATTDPQKLPATVLSRCLQFNLKNMSPELIVGYLQSVLQQESIASDESGLWLLARAANGSMRDALSLADQAINFCSGQLNENDVRAMLGTVELSFVYKLLAAVASQNAAEALQIVAQLSEHAPDYAGTLQELIALIHRVAVAQAVPAAVDNSRGDAAQVTELAHSITAEDAQLFYQTALIGKRDISLAADLRSGLEMVLLRMIAFRPGLVIDEALTEAELKPAAAAVNQADAGEAADPSKKPEPAALASEPLAEPLIQSRRPECAAQALASPPSPSQGPEITPSPPSGEPSPRGSAYPQQQAAKTEREFQLQPEARHPQSSGASCAAALEPGKWAELFEALQLKGLVYSVASNTELRQVDGNKAYFVLDEATASLYSDHHVEKMQAALTDYLGQPLEVSLEIGVPRYETPAALARRMLAERQQGAVRSIEGDPRVQLLLNRFEGSLDIESITPVKH